MSIKEKLYFVIVFLLFYTLFCGVDIFIIKILNPYISIKTEVIFVLIYYLFLGYILEFIDNINGNKRKFFIILLIIFSVYLASLVYPKIDFNFKNIVLLSMFIFLKVELIKYISKKRELRKN